MRPHRTALIVALLLALAASAARAAPSEAQKIVDGWVERIVSGHPVYAGGRQREIVKAHAENLLPALVEGFAHEDPRVGRNLLEIASLLPPRADPTPLLEAVGDDRPFVREFATIALGRMRVIEGIPRMTTAFRKGRLSIPSMTGALCNIGGGVAEQILIGMLRAYAEETRVGGAAALAEFDSPGARKALVEILDDPQPAVRKAALRSLAWIGTEKEVGVLETLLRKKDERSDVRVEALRTLRGIGGEKARTALFRHFNAERGERLEALSAAVAAGTPVGPGATTFAVRALAEETEPDRRLAATRILIRSEEPEARATLLAALPEEEDAEIAFLMASTLVARRVEGILPRLRALPERFPDLAGRTLDMLDRLGDPELPDRLRGAERIRHSPAGGPLARLVFHAGPEDVKRALDLARENPKDVGLVADAYLVVAVAGGPDVLEPLVREALRLPAVDRVVVAEGPKRPGLREQHMRVLRMRTGRVFGYDPTRPDVECRNAMRRALKWWIRRRRGQEEDALEVALAQLTDGTPYRRETALRVLHDAGRHDDVARVMNEDPVLAVSVTAARWLVEARDTRGVDWLIEHFPDEDLVDWCPFIDSPRATRLEAARALWRATNLRFEYRRVFHEEEWRRDLALEERRRYRQWRTHEGKRDFDTWFEDGCRRLGIELGEGKEALLRLADLLGEDRPRFLRVNALDQLRRRTGERILPLHVVDLEALAPGDDHPVFPALSWRWRERIESR